MSADSQIPRVAFVHSFLPVGGGTIYILNLASELIRRGVPAQVFSLSKGHPLADDFERRKIPVALGRWHGNIFEDRILHAMNRLARFAPDVVIANLESGPCEMLRLVPQGVLRIGVVHSLSRVQEATLYSDAIDHLVAVSEHVAEVLRLEPGLRGRTIHSIQPGVQVSSHLCRPKPEPGRPLRILYLGRLDAAAKRAHLFPVIFRQLREAGIPFTWTIAGDGPERSFLMSEMRNDHRGEQVRFAGEVPHAQVPTLLAGHDVLLLTSDTETFSLSLHEGMAAGLVPVVSDLPGPVRTAVTADVGLLVPPDDVGGYARAIIRLHHDRALLAAMSARAQHAIDTQHSVEVMADHWQALWAGTSREVVHWPERWPQPVPRRGTDAWRFTKWGRVLRRAGAKVFIRGSE